MFSDMDDMYFTNPSEADSIIDEATDRLRDLIRDDERFECFDFTIAAAFIKLFAGFILILEVSVKRDRVEISVALLIQSAAKSKVEFRIISLDGFIRTSIDTVILIIKVGVFPEAKDKRGFDLFTVCIDFI